VSNNANVEIKKIDDVEDVFEDIGETFYDLEELDVDLDNGTIESVSVHARSPHIDESRSLNIEIDGEEIGAKSYHNDYYQTHTHSGGDLPIDVEGDPKVELTRIDGGMSIDWIEFVYANGSTATVDGEELEEGESTDIPISNGEETDVQMDSQGIVDYDISWTETDGIEDLDMDVGSESIEEDGLVEEDELVYPIDLTTGETNIGVSYGGSDDDLSYVVEWDATTQTRDLSVSINGQTADHDGTLDDGETVDLDVDESWIESGTNTVEVGVNDPDEGPVGQVDLDYSHSTTGDAHSSSIDSTEWSEDKTVERSFSSDRDDVEIEIPLDDRVVDVRSVDVLIDDSEISADYDVDGTDLTVDVGEVFEDETVEIEVESRKVSVDNGEIEIIDPTVEGDRLDTEVEVVDVEDDLRIDVSGTQTVDEDERLIWTDNESYDPDTSSIIGSDDSQILSTNANSGSTFTAVSTDVIGPTVSSGTATITDIEESDDELGFSVDKSDSISVFGLGYDRIGYHGLISEDDRLVDEGDTHVETRDAGTFVVEEGEQSSLVGGISSPGDAGETLLGIPLFIWLIGGVVGGVAGAAAVSRRVGTEPDDRLSVAVFGIASTGVVVVAAELVTPYSLVDTFVSGVFGTIERLVVTVTSGAFAALLGALGILGLIVLIDQRTDVTVPLPYYVGSSALVSFFALRLSLRES